MSVHLSKGKSGVSSFHLRKIRCQFIYLKENPVSVHLSIDSHENPGRVAPGIAPWGSHRSGRARQRGIRLVKENPVSVHLSIDSHENPGRVAPGIAPWGSRRSGRARQRGIRLVMLRNARCRFILPVDK